MILEDSGKGFLKDLNNKIVQYLCLACVKQPKMHSYQKYLYRCWNYVVNDDNDADDNDDDDDDVDDGLASEEGDYSNHIINPSDIST